jgi:hypothetical protein
MVVDGERANDGYADQGFSDLVTKRSIGNGQIDFPVARYERPDVHNSDGDFDVLLFGQDTSDRFRQKVEPMVAMEATRMTSLLSSRRSSISAPITSVARLRIKTSLVPAGCSSA